MCLQNDILEETSAMAGVTGRGSLYRGRVAHLGLVATRPPQPRSLRVRSSSGRTATDLCTSQLTR